MDAIDTFLAYIVFGLVTWRLTSFLVREKGPLQIFAKLRDLIGVRYDERSLCFGLNPIAELFCCFWCMSVWVAWIVVALLYYIPEPTYYFVRVMAISAIAIYINGRVGSNGNH